MKHAIALIITLLTTVFSGSLSAEGVCDSLKSSTPGLYGLCQAYCSDSNSANDNKYASLLERYNEKRQLDDPPMPCLCPCYTIEDVQRIADRDDFIQCAVTSTASLPIAQSFEATSTDPFTSEHVFAFLNSQDDVYCRYQIMNGTNVLREWFGDYNYVEDQEIFESCLAVQEFVVILNDLTCFTNF